MKISRGRRYHFPQWLGRGIFPRENDCTWENINPQPPPTQLPCFVTSWQFKQNPSDGIHFAENEMEFSCSEKKNSISELLFHSDYFWFKLKNYTKFKWKSQGFCESFDLLLVEYSATLFHHSSSAVCEHISKITICTSHHWHKYM